MGCCSGICKGFLIFWSVIGAIFALAMLGFMAFKIEALPKQAANPDYFHDLLELLPGTGIYKNVTIINLTMYTWYAALGLAALMFVAAVMHIVSTCKSSRCLISLSTLLLLVTVAADVTGVIYKFKAQDSILAELELSLNHTIVEMYGKAGFEHVTNSWNLLGKNAACCGINSGDDFQHAKYWSGEIAADSAPCGATATKGCKEDLESHFISYDDIWFTSVIAVKVFLMLIMLLHTTCVCKSGLQHGISRDSESFRLVNKK